jgi:hypothetical protein
MAKIHSTTLVITVSQMLKDTDTTNVILDQNMIEQIEAVVTQLAAEGSAGSPVIVEVEKVEK